MARRQDGEPSIPAAVRPAYDAIVALIDGFCREYLNAEYEALCRKLAGVLARKRPSPLTRGKPQVWACAIVRVIGWVNFLNDSSQAPHLKLTQIDRGFGVAECTGQGKAKAIRDLLKIRQFDFRWMLPQRIEESPMAWMISVNGFIVDARRLKREVQEEAFRKGLIPYVPGEKPTKARQQRRRERAKAEPKPKSPFVGLWHIVSMGTWDVDYINAEAQAVMEFEENGTGHFHFGYVQGAIDWRPTTRDGEPAVEWSWEGSDEMAPATGRGWTVVKGKELHGLFIIYPGDESGFVATRAKAPKSPKRK